MREVLHQSYETLLIRLQKGQLVLKVLEQEELSMLVALD